MFFGSGLLTAASSKARALPSFRNGPAKFLDPQEADTDL
jgi:hypothetical protein